MKKLILLTLFITIFTTVSCSKKSDFGQPNVDFLNLEKDFMQWWTYHNNEIVLSSDFIPIDTTSNIIDKEVFLKILSSGDFIPLNLKSKDSNTYYKLFKLDHTANENIRSTIKNVSTKEYKHFKMEGKSFPEFNFMDLNEIKYTNENIKGKIVILKCWFINCKPCIAEFPELNKLVEKYQNRNDIIFISLAFDQKDDLKSFLLKNPFSYSVVPDQKEFMEDVLNISGYPTHFIIDKNGIIKKVVQNVHELISALDNINLSDTLANKGLPPPPPPPK